MTRIKLLVTVLSLGLFFYACEAESLDEALNNESANLTISKAASLQAQELENDPSEITTKSGDDDDKPGMDDESASGDDDDKPGMDDDDDGRSSGDDDDKPGMDDDDDGRSSGDDDDKPGMDDESDSGDDDDKPGMDDGRSASQKSGDDDDKPGMDDN